MLHHKNVLRAYLFCAAGHRDSEAIESDLPEGPIEAMRFEATTEAVAEAPVEVVAIDEPRETSAPDELTEPAALLAPRYAQASEATPEETRAPKRNRKPKTVADVAAAEATTQETPIRKGRPKQITLHGADAAPEARTQNTQTRKTRQKQKVPTATQSLTRSTLLAQLASVNAQLERLRPTEVPKIVEGIQQLMQEYELSIEDIAGKPSDEPAGRAVPTKTKAAPRPKYRDPKTGQTWSGRGRAPAWIGKKPERFLIDRLY
ncbi:MULTISPECIES: H-NS histone family protein [unclassified Cupriavidus]|uniref:H-NS histone family protein n=1 Tax=unclassified Cupriavidus TaxID=2640874 RepID=UPI00313D77DC